MIALWLLFELGADEAPATRPARARLTNRHDEKVTPVPDEPHDNCHQRGPRAGPAPFRMICHQIRPSEAPDMCRAQWEILRCRTRTAMLHKWMLAWSNDLTPQ